MSKRRQIIREHFSDVPELLSEDGGAGAFGALGGAGTNVHYSVQEGATQEGVNYIVSCDTCGTRNRILVSWQELIIVGNSRVPPGWKYENGRLFPDVGCANTSCQMITSIQLTPDEAAKAVKSAIAARYVNPQHVQQISQQLQQGR